MPWIKHIAPVLVLLVLIQYAPARAAEAGQETGLHIEVPVPLKASKLVFNIDHPAFAADQPIGLAQMKLVMERYKAAQIPIQIVAVFHGAMGYMLLNDAAYNNGPKSWKGNPFKAQIEALQQEGVQFEICVNTAKRNGWVNADFLPGVKVDGGATLRIVQLVQDGYVQIHP
jgi:uncharacterized protein